MSKTERHIYAKEPNKYWQLWALWVVVVFIMAQGLAWFHPHGHHHFSADVSKYCQIQFYDEASFCPHYENRVHLESSDKSDFSECHSCQQLIELSLYNCGLLLLSWADFEITSPPFPPLPLTNIYSTDRWGRAPPHLFA